MPEAARPQKGCVIFMCLLVDETILRDVIADKIVKNEAFTAFDITMQAKKRGLAIKHRDCKNTIHQIVWDEYPFYQRTLIDVPGAPVQPFLYYPQGYDISEYLPMDRDELFEPVVLDIPVPAVKPDDYNDVVVSGEVEDWYNDEDEDEVVLW